MQHTFRIQEEYFHGVANWHYSDVKTHMLYVQCVVSVQEFGTQFSYLHNMVPHFADFCGITNIQGQL